MNKYFVIDPNGVTHTRSTKRRYTHTVLVRYDREHAMQQAEASYVYDKESWDYYRKRVAGGSTVEDWVAVANKTLDEYKAERRAERIQRVDEHDYTQWLDAGWCGSLELANKLAGSERNHLHIKDVIIMEAQKK